MKVFLTGATGYIGSAVAAALQARGYSVAGSARTLEAEQKLLDRGITLPDGRTGRGHRAGASRRWRYSEWEPWVF